MTCGCARWGLLTSRSGAHPRRGGGCVSVTRPIRAGPLPGARPLQQVRKQSMVTVRRPAGGVLGVSMRVLLQRPWRPVL